MRNKPRPSASKPQKPVVNQAKLQELSALLQQGLSLHRDNQLQEAYSCYQKILAIDPKHFNAIQLTGTIQVQTGNHAAAVLLFDQALQISQSSAAVFYNRGNALRELNRFDEALASYSEATRINPDYAEAFINKGVTLQDLKRFDEALASYSEAIRIKPDYADAFNNRGITLKELNRFEEALASYAEAIRIKPNYAEAFNNRGISLQELKRFDEALASYSEAIRIKPDYADAFYNRGNALKELKHLDEALANYAEAIRIKPSYADAFNNRGIALKELKRFDEALVNYAEAIRIKPGYAEAFNNRGFALQEIERFDESLASFAEAIRLKPDYADAFYNRGNALKELNLFEDAFASYSEAIRINPAYAEAFNNQGIALKELKRFDEALANYSEAIRFKPDYAEAFNNQGVTLQELKRFDEALASYSEAIRIKPDYADAYWNQSLALLLLGNFVEGWRLYEWRLKKGDIKNNYFSGLQLAWRGKENISGKRLLIHSEQGLGDSIQFARYLPNVLALGAAVILQVQKPLVELFSSMNLPVTLIGKGDPLPEFDAYCPLLSLPYVFKTSLETMTPPMPYLFANQGKVSAWERRLGTRNRFRVGLVWSGSSSHKNDHNRSLTLQQLLPHLPDCCEYVSLQKEVRETDRQVLTGIGIRDYGEDLKDFADTAALCELMDLVISVDTSVVHLAGAMGKQAWLLLPHIPDFRWLLDRDDSPWYQRVRLFRQDERREWLPVLDRVKKELLGISQT